MKKSRIKCKILYNIICNQQRKARKIQKRSEEVKTDEIEDGNQLNR
jgi:hypothetical protein